MVTRNRLGPQALDGPAVAVYSAAPSTGDPRVPAAPSVLSATASIYQTRGGGYAAAAQLHWTASTTDVDGHLMGVSFTEIWARKNVTGATWATVANAAGDETDIQLEGFVPKDTWQFKVRAVSGQNKASAYSNTVDIKMPINDPPPLPPSVPILSSRLGTVSITWDGKASGGGPMPTDLKWVRVERHAVANFTPASGITLIDTIYPGGGLAVDAPLRVTDVWFYRLIAIDNAGQDSQPSGALSITVDGVKPLDLPLEIITPGMLSGQVANSIAEAARLATTASGDAANAAKIFSQPTMPTLAVEKMKLGDLWFDTSHGNLPYRYAVSGSTNAWITVRDDTLNKAFPSGTVLDPNFLDKDVIRSKFLQVGLIDAKDIAAKTITAESGVIGSLSADDIKFGQLDGAFIKAGTVTASSIFLGDTENLVDAPQFSSDPAWAQGGGVNQVGISVPVTDLPDSGTGRVWQVTGNATVRVVNNSRHVAVKAGDSFYAEGYVRKTATGTTGTAQLIMVVKRKAPLQDLPVVLAQHLFKTTDGANTWIKIDTIVVTGTAPNLITTTGIKVPADGYDVQLALRVNGDVVSGNIQFGSVMLRRQNSGQLIVDGSITSDQIKAGTIRADDIGAHQITAGQIDASTIRGDSLMAGSIVGNSAVIGQIDAAKITYGVLDGKYIKTTTITTGHMGFNTIKGDRITTNTLHADKIVGGTITSGKIGSQEIKAVNIHSGIITGGMINGRQIKATNIVTKTLTSNEIAVNTIYGDRIRGNQISAGHLTTNSVTAAKIVAGNVTGTKIAGTAIDAHTITGATYRSAGGTGRRVTLTKNGLVFYGSGNVPLLNLATSNGTFYIRSSSAASHFQLDNSGLRLYSGKTNTVNLSSNGGAYFKGNVSASSINGCNIQSGSYLTGNLSGGSYSGTHSGGKFSGTISNGATIYGGTYRSQNTGNRVEITADRMRIYSQGSLAGTISGDVASSGLNVFPMPGKSMFLGYDNELQIANGYMWSHAVWNNAAAGGAPVYVAANGFLTRHASSARYKTNMADLALTSRFMDIRTMTWHDKPSIAAVENRVTLKGNTRYTGFLAENLHEIGLADTVIYDKMGRPDSISQPSILAHTVRYVQHLTNRVDELTERIAVLEGASS